LNASETGHLVLSTVHSSTAIEALQRLVSAFPAEIQMNVAAQLADCLVAVIAQRLQFRPELNMRVPECEILLPTHSVKHFIRTREFFKISSVLETGAEHGMWTFQRYRTWLDKRTEWHTPLESSQEPDAPADSVPRRPVPVTLKKPDPESSRARGRTTGLDTSGRIEIEPVEGEFGKILKPGKSSAD
jgi:twitching motility protein PilT